MKIVAYYRVSTQKQGKSGLGLEGQQMAVEAFAKANGGLIIRTFTEVESGKRKDRPELGKALAHARLAKATLVIAKLDRLARNVAFLSNLMESGVDFKACDNPYADRFTVHILAAVAEKEAKDIADRTKRALAAYKARGGLLGSARPECRNNLSPEAAARGRELSAELRSEHARKFNADVIPQIAELRGSGLTYRQIAERLNADGLTTSRGNPWSHVLVRLVLERAGCGPKAPSRLGRPECTRRNPGATAGHSWRRPRPPRGTSSGARPRLKSVCVWSARAGEVATRIANVRVVKSRGRFLHEG